MGILKQFQQANDVQEDKDVLGGGGFLVESGADTYNIDLAFVGKSADGASFMTLHLGKGKTNIRETIYFTTRTGLTYFEKDGNKQNLPNFSLINSLTNVTLGKQLHELDTEQKMVKLYNFEQKKEIPTVVEMVSELMGQSVTVGVLKSIVDKTAKDGNGKYVPTGETKEINEIDKFFRASDGLTSTEIKSGIKEAVFLPAWKEKNTGVTRNKAKGTKTATAKPGAATGVGAGGSPKPASSLFADEAP